MNTIGERIRFARKKNDLTLTDINRLTGLSTGNLSELENNKFMPSANALIALRKVLNVSIDWILTGEEFESGTPSKEDVSDCIIKEASSKQYLLTEEESEIIEGYRKLDEEEKNHIKGFIKVCMANINDTEKEDER